MSNVKNTTPASTGLTRTEIQAAREQMSFAQRTGLKDATTVITLDTYVEGEEGAAFLQKATPEMAAAAAMRADVVAPVFVKIEPGDVLTGLYESQGTHDFVDEATGEVHTVKTYTVSTGGGKFRAWFLGAYELDRGMMNFPDDGSHEVSVFRGNDVKVGRNNVGRYRVMGRKVKEGRPRLAAPEPTVPTAAPSAEG